MHPTRMTIRPSTKIKKNQFGQFKRGSSKVAGIKQI